MNPPHAPRAALLSRFLSHQGGAAIIIAVLGLPLFVAALGLGAETGYWYMSQRQLQHAADLAAHAGAVRLQAGGTKAQVEAAALDVAKGSGYAADSISTFRLNTPPLTGLKAGDPMSVEVTLSRAHPPLLSSMFRSAAVNASGRAVSSVIWNGEQACVLALNPTASGAITASGSTNVTLNGCDLVSNSNAADAFLSSAGAVRARCVYAVGGVVGSPTLDCGAPVANSAPTRDPYGGVAEPVLTGACENASIGRPSATTTLTPVNMHPSGVPFMRFCSGIDVKGNLVMQPGLYIVEGEFKILGGSTSSTTDVTISGSGVTIYFTAGSKLALTGRTTVQLQAPTSGPYSGMLMFGSRTGAVITQQMTASPTTVMEGAIYLPKSDVQFGGNSTGAGGCLQVIANQVVFTGSSQLTANCAGKGTQPLKTAEKSVISE